MISFNKMPVHNCFRTLNIYKHRTFIQLFKLLDNPSK